MDAELIIRGGTVADGTGAAPYEADVTIAAGRIIAVEPPGSATAGAGRAAETIDARGMLVTPGFVDIHTHYDGQVVWDDRLTPSTLHGVTTVVMGNCGVGFAPVRREDRELIVELMEGIEDIPGPVLDAGMRWQWESFDDYVGYLSTRQFDADVATQLPHAPLRVYVMGARALALEPASEADIAEMRRLTAAAMRAGAVGFSTSRSLNHRSIKGAPTPSLRATEAELLGIAQGIADAGAGVMELASDFPRDVRDDELDMIERVSASTGVPWSFGMSQKNADPEGWRWFLERADRANANGARVAAQIAPRPVGAVITILNSSNPFQSVSRYRSVVAEATARGATLAELARELRDPSLRQAVFADLAAQRERAWIGRFGGFERVFLQTGPVVYEPSPEDALGPRAAREDRDPFELFYDLLHEGDGSAYAYFCVSNYSHFSLGAVREMLAHPATLLGLGDGGAHVGVIADASFPTYLLMRWARERNPDGFDLAWLVKRQAADTARHVGLSDRGVLAPGMKADLNVIDLDRLGHVPPVMVRDLPAGGLRLLQGATGYVATVVAGQVVSREGEPTGCLPGRLVRGPAAGPLRHARSNS